MNSAVEVEVTNYLNAQSSLVANVGVFFLDQRPKAPQFPMVTVQLLSDANTKHVLAKYGGEALIQFDIYHKKHDPGLRQKLKEGLRQMSGTVGQLNHVWAVVTNEVTQGIDSAGVWRWTVDATIYWEE